MEFDPLFKPDLQAVLELYGTFVPSYGSGWVKVICPRFDHDERRPSATVHLDAGKWNCFACAEHGDALDLIQYNEGVADARQAATWAENHGLPGANQQVDSRQRRRPRGGAATRHDRTTATRTARPASRWH
jgi:DNA primase